VRRRLANPPRQPTPPAPPLAKGGRDGLVPPLANGESGGVTPPLGKGGMGGVEPAPPDIKLRIPHWARWLGLDASIEAQLAPLRAWCAAQSGKPPIPPEPDESASRLEQILDALLVGYTMSLQRLERAMEQHGLETIACAGEPFDPETMEVAEVVRDEGRSGTIVLDEIRKGYRWRGRVFRFAQVRVARP
jgi:GrpE